MGLLYRACGRRILVTTNMGLDNIIIHINVIITISNALIIIIIIMSIIVIRIIIIIIIIICSSSSSSLFQHLPSLLMFMFIIIIIIIIMISIIIIIVIIIHCTRLIYICEGLYSCYTTTITTRLLVQILVLSYIFGMVRP